MNEKALDNKCPSCGAPLLFKPKSNKWECDHCKSSFTLEELKKFNNASSDENNKKEEVKDEPKAVKKEVKDNTVYVTYNCKNCGAEIIADEQTASGGKPHAAQAERDNLERFDFLGCFPCAACLCNRGECQHRCGC